MLLKGLNQQHLKKIDQEENLHLTYIAMYGTRNCTKQNWKKYFFSQDLPCDILFPEEILKSYCMNKEAIPNSKSFELISKMKPVHFTSKIDVGFILGTQCNIIKIFIGSLRNKMFFFVIGIQLIVLKAFYVLHFND